MKYITDCIRQLTATFVFSVSFTPAIAIEPYWVEQHFCASRPAHNPCITGTLTCGNIMTPSWTTPTVTNCYWQSRDGRLNGPFECYFLTRGTYVDYTRHFFTNLSSGFGKPDVRRTSVVNARMEGLHIDSEPAQEVTRDGLTCFIGKRSREGLCFDGTNQCRPY